VLVAPELLSNLGAVLDIIAAALLTTLILTGARRLALRATQR
jgi:hypothetical protein